VVYDETMLVNVKPHEFMVTVGNDSKLKVLSNGTYPGHTIDDNGEKVNIKLLDVLNVPELTVHLISVTKAVSQLGVFFVGSDQAFQLKTETQSFTFDKQLKYGSGKLYTADFYPNHQHTKGEMALAVTTIPFKDLIVYWDIVTNTQAWILQHHNIVLTQNTKHPCPHVLTVLKHKLG
jgi:hypothetical protein